MVDVCSVIDCKMLSIAQDHGPFSSGGVELLIYKIVKEMDLLHKHYIVHGNLKTFNFLYTRDE